MTIENDLLLKVLSGQPVDRPPIWLMRQAGRILPQYRKVRASMGGFIDLVKNPEKVSVVSVQPLDELDVDAVILFSDILVIPEAMGLPYTMVESKGPFFPRTISSVSDVAGLVSGDEAAQRLDYVYKGIETTLARIDGRVPLIGFSGSPFTLFCYMIEGQGSKTFSKAKALMYADEQAAHALLQKITDTIISYLRLKIEAGVHVVQLFDSWAGMLDKYMYQKFAVPYIRQITTAVGGEVPVIVFSKGAWFALEDLVDIQPAALGIDWHTAPSYARKVCGPDLPLQGNMDPCMLYGSKEAIGRKADEIIKEFGSNHIFNLGHGVYPDTPLDNVRHLIQTVKSYRY